MLLSEFKRVKSCYHELPFLTAWSGLDLLAILSVCLKNKPQRQLQAIQIQKQTTFHKKQNNSRFVPCQGAGAGPGPGRPAYKGNSIIAEAACFSDKTGLSDCLSGVRR